MCCSGRGGLVTVTGRCRRVMPISKGAPPPAQGAAMPPPEPGLGSSGVQQTGSYGTRSPGGAYGGAFAGCSPRLCCSLCITLRHLRDSPLKTQMHKMACHPAGRQPAGGVPPHPTGRRTPPHAVHQHPSQLPSSQVGPALSHASFAACMASLHVEVETSGCTLGWSK